MLFNSPEFLFFLPIVFAVYWLIGGTQGALRHGRPMLQNLFVVLASSFFYGWWDPRCLLLIALTACCAYLAGRCLERFPARGRGAKTVLLLSLLVNLGILGYFKYAGFFLEQATLLLGALGFRVHPHTLTVMLPVGISFYTFQALGYVIDVYRGTLRPTRDPIAFFAFVSFFPQLVAGPIERAPQLLPQFLRPRRFDAALAAEGCRQMLWGFFKKVLVADTCAVAANAILGAYTHSFVSLWLGIIAFTVQIYGDFSGYSDIALGCAKLFGIRLTRNFAVPYFSRDIAEFWRRWHISLTAWFRDYVYIPLGGSRCGRAKQIRNILAVFLLSGLWHGANLTFVAWGAFHALCFLPLVLLKRSRRYTDGTVAEGKILPSVSDLLRMAGTLLIVMLGWTVFRAPDIATAGIWLKHMLFPTEFTLVGLGLTTFARAVPYMVILFVLEWFARTRPMPPVPKRAWVRLILYALAASAVFFFRPGPQTFIYFRF